MKYFFFIQWDKNGDSLAVTEGYATPEGREEAWKHTQEKMLLAKTTRLSCFVMNRFEMQEVARYDVPTA